MSVSEFAVRRWQVTLVVFLMLIALGATSLASIPKSEDPIYPYPAYAIVAVLPGASPRDVERLVVEPVEAKIEGLDDVKRMKADIEDGLAVVAVEFEANVDAERKHDGVLREMTALRPTLPPELVRLDVNTFSAANVSILQVALVSSSAPYRDLGRLARSLKRRLEGTPGVGEVQIAGLPKQEVTVALDVPRMTGLGLSAAEVTAAIAGDGANVPAGSVDVGSKRFSVKTTGDYASVDEVRAAVVRSASGASVRVRDVAEVSLGDAEPVHLVRFEGRRAVVVSVAQRAGQNIFAVREALGREVDAFGRELPAGVALAYGFDQAQNVGHRLGGFTRDFALAILFVLVTLLPLGLRASAVVMVSIPLSLSVGIALLHLAGQSVNQLSLVGLVIALGLLVDDSVVVVENIARFLRLGRSPTEAAVEGTRQITVPVLGCTATLILAFLPLLALPGSAGLFLRGLPLAVVSTVAASLAVSLTVVPFLASRVLTREGEHGNAAFRLMTWAVEGSYRRVLAAALRRPALALGAAAALVVGSLSLVPRIGVSVFPKAGIPQFLVFVEMPDGTSLAETDRATRWVEGVLARHPEVRKVTANVGKGNPRVYYNVMPRGEKPSAAEVFAELDSHDPRRNEAVVRRLRAELGAGYPDAEIELHEFENGPPMEAPVALRVLGDDPAAIGLAAAAVEGVLREVEGTRDVRNPTSGRKSDVRVAVDREKAAQLGAPVAELERAVRLAVGGLVVGHFRDDASDEALDIRVTVPRAPPADDLPGGARPTLAALDQVYVPTARGAVPLAQVAALEFERSASRLSHYKRSRSTTLTAQVRDGYNTDRVTKAVLARVARLELPPGVRIEPAGEVENREESFGGVGAAVIVALFGVLAVLVLEFRTFKSTLIVASVIPLGVVGGLAALFVSGYSLSFTATVGFVALMGIEVKNSILLVDFTDQLRAGGAPLDEAIRRAGEVRFVPILLTTLTALGGLVPLMLEHSSLYSPLAVVIAGGLVSSTLLARVVTPVLYKLLAPRVEPAAAPADAAPSIELPWQA